MTTVGELAEYLGLALGDNDPALVVDGIAPVSEAGPGDLAFVAEKRYLTELASTRAGCVLLKPEWQELSPVPTLCADDPYLCYARVSAIFDRGTMLSEGVHETAAVDASAQLGEGVRIGPGASVAAGAVIGDAVIIEAGARVGAGAHVGRGSRLFPNVVLYHGVSLGDHCVVHANSTIGSDGFGFARGPGGWEKIHQLGSVRVGDNVEIGAGVTIDRGALGDTVISDGVIIDNQVHIAHNVVIGKRTAIAGCVGFAGSTTVGEDCTFAGQVGVSGHLSICDNVHFTGQARVTRSIDEPGTYGSGTPLETMRVWRRNAVRFNQLDEMAKRIRALEARLNELSADDQDAAAGTAAGSGAEAAGRDRTSSTDRESGA